MFVSHRSWIKSINIFENHWEANETNICNQENTVDVRLNKKKNTSYFDFDYSANKLLKYYSWASV